ncbi:MAG TPA: radical SAM protein, partial [Desulfuromonadales bacterium]|nr:radical SAM protein [Desulfuromonadales bacterium]
MTTHHNHDNYQGFELGPIRPPSEANSLLLRITRNCPWNKCTFCGLYKGEMFGIRKVDHIRRDIDRVRHYVDEIEKTVNAKAGEHRALASLQAGLTRADQLAFHAAMTFMRGGMKSIFLQDANTLVVKPDDLVEILQHARQAFPHVDRVTSYARSASVARIGDDDMSRLAAAGLNRVHIGMESAADEVLAFVRKGVDKQTQILAGQKVKKAGIELSEYFMPGLGGEALSRENALETADALNQINADFIRIRTLAIPEVVELHKEIEAGTFKPLDGKQKAEELLIFLDHLQGINSTVKSDHILNLLQEVEGRLPQDQGSMTAPIRAFLAMEPQKQMFYIVGRRTG